MLEQLLQPLTFLHSHEVFQDDDNRPDDTYEHIIIAQRYCTTKAIVYNWIFLILPLLLHGFLLYIILYRIIGDNQSL